MNAIRESRLGEAKEIQLEVRAGAKRECLSKLVARVKHDRTDDDAEDERDEETAVPLFDSRQLDDG